MRYRLKKDRFIREELQGRKGDIVYKFKGFSYGLADDDEYFTGKPHICVTFNKEGDYPFFTIPTEDVEELREDN